MSKDSLSKPSPDLAAILLARIELQGAQLAAIEALCTQILQKMDENGANSVDKNGFLQRLANHPAQW